MKLLPYIIFNGKCEEALHFYERVMGGEIRNLMQYKGSPAEASANNINDVLHAHFAVDGNVLFMSSDSGKGATVPSTAGMVYLSLDFEDHGRMQNVFAAMSDGGRVLMPLQDTFWGAHFGMLVDRYGVNWMFNCEKTK
jgi:PhnB protein